MDLLHPYCFKLTIVFFVLISGAATAHAQGVPPRERICGKWENQEKTLRIQITATKSDFVARIIWFSDTEGKPMGYWKDKRNPNPALRNRPLLGMSILKGLRYHPETRSWEGGKVYDSRHGKEWNAAATIGPQGLLRVRGYWHFKFLGRTMNFHRIR